MKHLGDITKISGYTAPIVDCIIGGSPCQDLSVAGKRAGLDGERSGLYIEQVRIVKEMRAEDERNGRTGVDIRPRYMVWENVPGAFSSNKGEDFRIVLEELAKVKDKDAVIPMYNAGKWTNHGCILGDGWSVAWRVLDAQFWGVPQRRRRIALVADFGGQSAPEILFVRQSVSGHFESSEQKRQGTPSDAERSIGSDDRARTVCYGISSYDSDAMKSSNPHSGIYEADTSRTLDLNGGTPACNQDGIAVVEPKAHGFPLGFRPENVRCYEEKATTLCNGTRAGFCNGVIVGGDIYNTTITGDKVCSLTAGGYGSTGTSPKVMLLDDQGGQQMSVRTDGKVPTLRAEAHGNVPCAVTLEPGIAAREGGHIYEGVSGTLRANAGDNQMSVAYSVENHPADSRVNLDESGKVQTLNATEVHGAAYAIDQQGGKGGANYAKDVMPTLCSDSHGTPHAVAYKEPIALDRYSFNQGQNALYKPQFYEDGTNPTLVAKGPSAVAYSIGNGQLHDAVSPSKEVSKTLNCMCDPMKGYIVRRLTPLECERLQGYPDGWTDIGEYIDSTGKKRQPSDAARYKALGNSIALPPWKWVLKRICACYERDATMASLFDGIGGFPYLWEQLNGKGTCLWASEIEEFPIAVTKLRIGGDT